MASYDPDLDPVFDDLRRLIGDQIDPAELEARLRPLTRRLTALERRATAAELASGQAEAAITAIFDLLEKLDARLDAAEERAVSLLGEIRTQLASHAARLDALEGVEEPEEPGEPIALIVAPVLTLREDAPVGSAVAAIITDADTLALDGDDADLLALDGNDVLTAASIEGRTALAFNVTGTAAGKADATESVSVPVEAVDEPPVDPGDEVVAPSLGMGLARPTDWGTAHPFMDRIKSARTWIGHTASQWGGVPQSAIAAVQDADGWLTAMPAGADRVEMLCMWDQPASGTSLAGRYRFRLLEGGGEIHVNGQRVAGNTASVNFAPNGGPGIAIAIRAITAKPKFDLVHERDIPAYDAGAIFRPEWLALVKDFGELRFMDWMHTNSSTQSEWSNRPKPGDYTFDWRGVPLERMIEACNLTGADAWWNAPHRATDEYIRKSGEMVRDRLRRLNRMIPEYSNEWWNWGGPFQQTHWLQAEAAKIWPGKSDGWAQLGAGKAANMMRILRDVFKDQPERLTGVLAHHPSAGLHTTVQDAPDWVARDGGGKRPVEYFDLWATTSYFGFSLGNERAAEVLGWIDDHGEAEALTRAIAVLAADVERLRDHFRYHKGMADRGGLRLVVYEGGSHAAGVGAWVENARLTAFLATLHRDPRMEGLYARMLEIAREEGVTTHALFVEADIHRKHGPWGHWLTPDDKTSPRGAAIVAHNREHPRDWEARPAGTFIGRAP